MDTQNKAFLKAAKKLKLNYTANSKLDILEINLGKKKYLFHSYFNPLNRYDSYALVTNKNLLNQILHHYKFSTPKAILLSKEQFENSPVSDLIDTLSYPLVIKPNTNSYAGQGVCCNIENSQELTKHLHTVFVRHPKVQIEEYQGGLKEYRILILKNKIIAIAERCAASVVGNGEDSILKLVENKNRQRISVAKDIMLDPIVFDEECKIYLKRHGFTEHTILNNGQRIQLCYTSNLGRGGDMFPISSQPHPTIAKKMKSLIQLTQLEFAGIDMLCENIEKPVGENYYILEVNPFPYFVPHEIPQNEEAPVLVARKVLTILIKKHPLAYLLMLSKCFLNSLLGKCCLLLLIAILILLSTKF